MPSQDAIPRDAIRARGGSCAALFVILSVAIFLSLSVGVVPLFAEVSESKAKPAVASEILTVEGTIEVWLATSNEWKVAAAGTLLRPGDKLRTGKNSRATVRLADLSVLRVSELTVFEMLPPVESTRKPLIDLKNGSLYFMSREKPMDIRFRTPTAAGAIRGTEFNVRVPDDGSTRLALFEGEVELNNEAGRVVLRGGEQATVLRGQAPTKTALIDAVSVIQWCLYYPAVIDLDEIPFSNSEKEQLRDSLAAYRSGDLLNALAALPSTIPASEATAIYRAAVELSVGRVDEAEKSMQGAASTLSLSMALREMIATVQARPWTPTNTPVLASEWLARSYQLQSRANLDDALKAAEAAVKKSPSFGFGWARVAELEMSFGRLDQADAALDKALAATPRNAQALALKGFIVAANGRHAEARRWFDQAIAADGALGNAWLGRGLVRLRQGEREKGREDLQVAAALEPQRSLLRSYLGKAFANENNYLLAEKDLELARRLDPNDPTPWLYSALLNQQHNRINEAIRDLEASQERNDNRQVYRSKLLLDQDRAVRSANLASIYQDAGMNDVSLREAGQAVDADYANFSAHLFLSDSYDAMRDPTLFNRRYQPPAKTEWLMANLLAPVGVGTLSRSPGQQDFAWLFDRDRIGLSSSTEYFSNGEWVESASQFGNFGKVAYAVDTFYRTTPGTRPNNDLEQFQLAGQVKAQLTRDDSVFLGIEGFKQETGDIIQYHSQTNYNPTLRVTETQEPNLFLGYHHEWSPGSHTLFLFNRLDDTLEQSAQGIELPFFKFGRGTNRPPTSILPRPFDLDFERDYTANAVELQQIWQFDPHTLIVGGRYQFGNVDATATLTEVSPAAGWTFDPIPSASEADMNRLSLYAYYQWQVFEPLRLTAGVCYDRLHYPWNVDAAPISAEETTTEKMQPKAGLSYTPWRNGVLRGMFSRSLSGFLHEASFQLEPTQIAGFNQSFGSVIPEAVGGLLSGAEFQVGSVAFDQKFPTGTYLSVEGQWLSSDADKCLGAVTSTRPFVEPDLPYGVRQEFEFKEQTLYVTANQLLANEWSIGARYRLSHASLLGSFPAVAADLPNFSSLALNRDESGLLHQLNLMLAFNHRCGFFAEFDSIYNCQSNDGYAPARPGDQFWQFNLLAGYRFFNGRAEIRAGLLNLTGTDYQLNPINLYHELPRERMFTCGAKFIF